MICAEAVGELPEALGASREQNVRENGLLILRSLAHDDSGVISELEEAICPSTREENWLLLCEKARDGRR